MNPASWGQQNFCYLHISALAFLSELSIRLGLSVLNKASQNAFVKLNKAVEVSNGVEIITVAMAGVGPGPASQLSRLTIEMLGVKYVSISDQSVLSQYHQLHWVVSWRHPSVLCQFLLVLHVHRDVLLKLTQTSSPPTIIVPTSPSCG